MIRSKSYLIFGAVVIFVLSACNSNQSQPTDTLTTGSITISADETFKPILEAELAVFHALYPYAHVNVDYKTETEALNDLLRDSTRLIISTRTLRQNEMDFFLEKKLFPKTLMIAVDAVALIVNPDNSDTIISSKDFTNVLTGAITKWDQLSKQSVNKPIEVVFDNKNSSTVRYVLDSLCKGQKISGTHIAVNKNSEVIEYVSSHPNAIGVIGVSWISDRDDSTMLSFLNKVKVMSVSKDSIARLSTSFQPYQAYIGSGTYPFIRNVYVIISEPRKGLATGFAAFLASERGQRIVLKSGILPATQPYRIISVRENL
jgi:phosphate transport system substrate-binding protein